MHDVRPGRRFRSVGTRSTGNSWVVNTQTKGSKAVADCLPAADRQQGRHSPTRVGMHRLIHSIQSGSADRYRGRRLGSPTVHRLPPVALAAGEWKVTQLGNWFGNGYQDRRLMVVPAWPCSRVPSTRPKPWSSLTGSTPRLMTLSPRALSWPPPPRMPRPLQKWSDLLQRTGRHG